MLEKFIDGNENMRANGITFLDNQVATSSRHTSNCKLKPIKHRLGKV